MGVTNNTMSQYCSERILHAQSPSSYVVSVRLLYCILTNSLVIGKTSRDHNFAILMGAVPHDAGQVSLSIGDSNPGIVGTQRIPSHRRQCILVRMGQENASNHLAIFILEQIRLVIIVSR